MKTGGSRAGKPKIILRKLAALMLSLAMLAALTTAALASDGSIDIDRECSLTVQYKNGIVIPGATVFLYRVASVSSSGAYALTEDFELSNVDLSDLADASSSYLTDLAETLSAYAAAESIVVTSYGTTDSEGYVKFDSLETGLYLVTAMKIVIDGTAYTPSPMLVFLPSQGADGGLDYDPVVNMKDGSGTPEDEYVDIVVKKVWKNDSAEDRPDYVDVEITMELLKDGEAYGTVTLNEANNWTYTWENLESQYNWQMYESESPEGYTVLTQRNDSDSSRTFTVTNTYAGGTSAAKGGSSLSGTTLPQTGQLNWPIPILSCIGLLMILAGWNLVSMKRRVRA